MPRRNDRNRAPSNRGKSVSRPLTGRPGRGTARPAAGADGRKPLGKSHGSAPQSVLIYGLHAVMAALANPARTVERLIVTENARRTLEPAIQGRGLVNIELATPKAIAQIVGDGAVHQGAVLFTGPLRQHDPADLAPSDATPAPTVLVLDQVTDPHNVGAILRSAAVFGVYGLVMTQRNSPPLGEIVAKAASGGLEHVRVVLVTNLARALRDLGDLGYHRIGLDGDGPAPLTRNRASGATALVLGAEGTGLRRLTRETCDELCHLPTAGPLRSLNVSNAAAVALAITTHTTTTG